MKAWKNFVFVRLSAVSSPGMKMRSMRWEIRTVRPWVFTSHLRGLYADFKPATTYLSEQG